MWALTFFRGILNLIPARLQHIMEDEEEVISVSSHEVYKMQELVVSVMFLLL